MADPPRIWLSNRTPARGEVVTVRTMVTHQMETGLRKTPEGDLIPRNIVNAFECTLDGALLFAWAPETAVAQNPYLEFRFMADASGTLRMTWTADDGQLIEAAEEITVTG